MSFDFGRMLGGGGRGRERRRMSVGEARPLLEEAEVERLFPQVGAGCVCMRGHVIAWCLALGWGLRRQVGDSISGSAMCM